LSADYRFFLKKLKTDDVVMLANDSYRIDSEPIVEVETEETFDKNVNMVKNTSFENSLDDKVKILGSSSEDSKIFEEKAHYDPAFQKIVYNDSKNSTLFVMSDYDKEILQKFSAFNLVELQSH
jgi:hypothetical protein